MPHPKLGRILSPARLTRLRYPRAGDASLGSDKESHYQTVTTLLVFLRNR